MALFELWYVSLAIVVVASLVISKTTNVFESATNYIGRNLTDGVRGLTLNAIGSSMPEFLTTVFFLFLAAPEHLGRDFSASVGGNTGSAIFNSIVIPMFVIWVVLATGVKGVKLSKKVILRDGLFLIAAEIILMVLLSSKQIKIGHGLLLTGFYGIYLTYAFLSMKRQNISSGAETPIQFDEGSSWYERYQFKAQDGILHRSWMLLLLSVAVLSIACAGLVEACKGLAIALNINPLFIALILVAAASSVPDAILSMRDAKRGNYDDSLSNVIGSNIFDITISMGLPLAVYLMVTGQSINFVDHGPKLVDIRIVLILITIVTMSIFYFSKNLKKKHVVALGLLYLLFITYTMGAADYFAERDSFLAKLSGSFIEWLTQPGGIGELLNKLAN